MNNEYEIKVNPKSINIGIGGAAITLHISMTALRSLPMELGDTYPRTELVFDTLEKVLGCTLDSDKLWNKVSDEMRKLKPLKTKPHRNTNAI